MMLMMEMLLACLPVNLVVQVVQYKIITRWDIFSQEPERKVKNLGSQGKKIYPLTSLDDN